MKTWLIITFLFFTTILTPVFSDDTCVLRNRLNKIDSFHANFIQQITNAEGDVVQEGMGELWMRRPNLFNWHVISPNESVLVSDGKTLWFYNPLVKQVTANWLQNITDNPLFMLIANNIPDWCQYHVKQQRDTFFLIPKSSDKNLKRLTIKITTNGTIEGLTFIEQNGQSNVYQMRNQRNNLVDNSKFYFSLPRDVTLDDQRQ